MCCSFTTVCKAQPVDNNHFHPHSKTSSFQIAIILERQEERKGFLCCYYSGCFGFGVYTSVVSYLETDKETICLNIYKLRNANKAKHLLLLLLINIEVLKF